MTNIVKAQTTALSTNMAGGFTAALASMLGGTGFPTLSTKNNRFIEVRKTERRVITVPGDDDTPVASVQVVIINANTRLSKTYYAQGYEEGSTEKPSCASVNGIAPDARVESPVAKSCATCSKNVWGTGPNGKGKACSDTLRMAVAPAANLNDPMLFRVTPGNLKALGEYMQKLQSSKKGAEAVITKIKFGEGQGKLLFEPTGLLDDDQLADVRGMMHSDIVQRIIGVSEMPHEDEATDEAVPFESPKVEKPAAPKVEKPAAPKPEKAATPKAEKPAPNLLDEFDALLSGKSDD